MKDNVIELETTYNSLFVEIDLGYICNYRCSYCNTTNHSGNKWLELNVVKHFIDSVKPDVVSLVGGEPTFYPHIKEILQYLKEKNMLTMLITNNSVPLKWWKDNIHLIDKVVASYHIEFADFEKFKENIIFIKDYSYVTINFSMVYGRFDECWNLIQQLKEINNLFITIKLLNNQKTRKLYAYTKKQLEKAKKPIITKLTERINKNYLPIAKIFEIYDNNTKKEIYPHELIASQENKFKGWLCWKGINILKVEGNGDIYKAICEAKTEKFKPFASIYDDKIIVPKEPEICQKELCTCIGDLKYLRKERI